MLLSIILCFIHLLVIVFSLLIRAPRFLLPIYKIHRDASRSRKDFLRVFDHKISVDRAENGQLKVWEREWVSRSGDEYSSSQHRFVPSRSGESRRAPRIPTGAREPPAITRANWEVISLHRRCVSYMSMASLASCRGQNRRPFSQCLPL